MTGLGEDDRFAQILDECCQRVRRGEPLERCLEDYPTEYRAELGRLAPIAGRVSLLSRDPSPQFRADLEQRLLASVDEARRGQRAGLGARVGRALASPSFARAVAIAMAIVLLLGLGGFGMDQAAADSLPDSPLYQVKTAREQLQLALARAPESQVDVRARLITQRGNELSLAIERGKQAKVVESLAARVENTADQMVQQALTARSKGNAVPARRALVALRAAQRRLDATILRAQPSVRPVLEELQGHFQQQEQRLLPAVGGNQAPGTRPTQPQRLPRD